MASKTLWIFNHYAHGADVPGGTRHFDLARELVRRGYKVTIFASGFQYSRHREMNLVSYESWKVEDVDGVRFVWLKTFPYQRNDWRRVLNMVSYMLRVWRLGRRLSELSSGVEKPDAIIGSSVHLLAVLAAYWVAKHHRARFIMEVRDLWPQTIIDMGVLNERNPIIKVLQLLERFLYRRAEQVIIVAPRMGDYISARGIGEEKLVWIPNGVDLSRFESIKLAEKDSKEFKIMYLGAHGQANALDVLLEAASLVQDKGCSTVRFVLIGDGSEKPRLIEMARGLGLKNVEFRDPIPKTEIPKTLSEANVLAFNLGKIETLKYGVSANKLFDYMAAGKPVIFSVKASNNPIDEAHCGLTVPPQDPQSLAEAVIKLSQIPQGEREAMGRRGREYVEKYHAIPVLVDRLIQCIEQVQKQ